VISLQVIFWLLVIIFAIIGAVRGWASEVLVTFSSVLGIFILFILENFAGFAKESTLFTDPVSNFWLKAVFLRVWSLLGIRRPISRAFRHARFMYKSTVDHLAGLLMGA
jgi:hypothetical protein